MDNAVISAELEQKLMEYFHKHSVEVDSFSIFSVQFRAVKNKKEVYYGQEVVFGMLLFSAVK